MLPFTYAVAVQCQDQQFQGLQVQGGIGMLSTMTCAMEVLHMGMLPSSKISKGLQIIFRHMSPTGHLTLRAVNNHLQKLEILH
jgi:hypothetical protein